MWGLRAVSKSRCTDGNQEQRFFGVYSCCEKIKAQQGELNG
jgi:hypothetical protein